jgi:hypothetical protein
VQLAAPAAISNTSTCSQRHPHSRWLRAFITTSAVRLSRSHASFFSSLKDNTHPHLTITSHSLTGLSQKSDFRNHPTLQMLQAGLHDSKHHHLWPRSVVICESS